MDAWTDPAIETLVLMASSQSGKTEVGLNCEGRMIHLEPGPALWVAPTLETARATSKDRMAPMIRLCPELAERVAIPRARTGSATILHRTFPGGHITVAGANSPASLASRPIRYLILDEVDRYPSSVGGEGDPIALAIVRTRTFTRRRKILVVSSPTLESTSRIAAWYAISDQRRYWLPCPRCGELFVPTWGHPSRGEWGTVRWEGTQAASVWIQCPECQGRIEDYERPAMVAAGQWRASAPFTGVAGWHLWEFLAPWRPLRDFVKQYLDAQTSIEARQAFANTVEGRVWQPPAESVEPTALLSRREVYPNQTLPEGVRLLTAGVDVQDDRLEPLVVGWGVGEEAWVLARETILGDPGRPDVWAELDELLTQPWRLPGGGTLTVACALVDAGGHRSQGVYAAVVARQARRVYACFGRAGGLSGLLVSPSKPLKTGAGTIHRRLVDSHQAKVILYARLKQTEPGPEAVHFPMGLGAQFFDELTAERLVTKRNKLGVPEKVWEQIRERNESLDAMVYALAALRVLAPTPARLTMLLNRSGHAP